MKTIDLAINLKGVWKEYHSPIRKREKFNAIENVSMKIHKGDKVGIIGENGAGKTTILKLIAGIIKPTRGSVETQGQLIYLINLEAGFNEELTGRENILLNGMIYGLTREEVVVEEKKIIDFADIGEFIDAPFFVYSSEISSRWKRK